MQFTRTNIITEGGTGKSLSSGGIVLEGNQGGGGSEYIHPTGWLWGNRYTGRETLDGDLTSNGTITANTFNGVNANITNISATYGSISSLSAWDADIHGLDADMAEIDSANITDATIRNLYVSGSAHFVELIIDKINSTAGSILVSPAHAELSRVYVNAGTNDVVCCFKTTDGDKKITNDFRVGDLVICQQFNVTEGVNQNVSNKYVWKMVTEVGTFHDTQEHYFVVKETQWANNNTGYSNYIAYGTNDEFAAGDEVCVLGNYSDTERQSAILISSTTNPYLKISHAKEELFYSPYMSALGTRMNLDRTLSYLSFQGKTEDLVESYGISDSRNLYWNTTNLKVAYRLKEGVHISVPMLMRSHNIGGDLNNNGFTGKSCFVISLGGGLADGYDISQKTIPNKLHLVLYQQRNTNKWVYRLISLVHENGVDPDSVDFPSNTDFQYNQWRYVPVSDELVIEDAPSRLSSSFTSYIDIDSNGFSVNGVLCENDGYASQEAYEDFRYNYQPAVCSDNLFGGVILTDNKLLSASIKYNGNTIFEYAPTIASEQILDNPHFEYGSSAWTISNMWMKMDRGYDYTNYDENAELKDKQTIEYYRTPVSTAISNVWFEQSKKLSTGTYILDFDLMSSVDNESIMPSGVDSSEWRKFKVRCQYDGNQVNSCNFYPTDNGVHKYRAVIKVNDAYSETTEFGDMIVIKPTSTNLVTIRIEATGYQNFWCASNVTLYKCSEDVNKQSQYSNIQDAVVVSLRSQGGEDQYGNIISTTTYKYWRNLNYIYNSPTYIAAHNDNLSRTQSGVLNDDYTYWRFIRNNIEAPAIITFDNINTYSLYNRQVSVMSPRYNLLSASSLKGLDDEILKSASFELLEDQIQMKVSQTEFNTLSQTVTNQGTLISQNASAITLKADKTTVNTLSGEVSNLSSTISQTAAQVAINVSSISQLNGDVSSLNSSITVLSDRITLNSSAITSLNGSVSTLESEFSVIPGQISSIVSSISSLEGEDVRLWSSISQLPTEISAYVYNEIDGDLTQTGIDITNHQISLTADNFIVKNNNNNPTLYLNSQGLVESRLGFVTNPRTGSEETFNPTFYALSMERFNNDPLRYAFGLNGYNKAYQNEPVINQNPDYTDSVLIDHFKFSTDVYNRTSDLGVRIPILTMNQDEVALYDESSNYYEKGILRDRFTLKLQPKEIAITWHGGQGTPQLGTVRDLEGNQVPGVEGWIGGNDKIISIGPGGCYLKDAISTVIYTGQDSFEEWIRSHGTDTTWTNIPSGAMVRVKHYAGDSYSQVIIKD